ncbi:hypothetical protein DM860_006934 [Cuscuta australis]|uniref:Uncharacterized protein n=1 Tax=Cuscuta australis TaxID=267555 RepID=A0A328E5L3_9ASTE|nr:hypothetical protein DM860_006934 [Cuscuta australis]
MISSLLSRLGSLSSEHGLFGPVIGAVQLLSASATSRRSTTSAFPASRRATTYAFATSRHFLCIPLEPPANSSKSDAFSDHRLTLANSSKPDQRVSSD